MKIPMQCCAVLLLVSLTATAQQGSRAVYKCMHPDGRIEYSALPVAAAACEPIAGIAPVPPTPAPETTAEVEPEPSERELTPQQRNCQQARRNLDILESEDTVAVTDAEGNTVLLDDERRETALQQALRDRDYWCE